MLTAICHERGHNRGWIAHKFKEKFGTWPAWGVDVEPITPSAEVRSWVRSRNIAYAKSRAAAATAEHVSGLTLSSSAVPIGGFWQSNNPDDVPW